MCSKIYNKNAISNEIDDKLILQGDNIKATNEELDLIRKNLKIIKSQYIFNLGPKPLNLVI